MPLSRAALSSSIFSSILVCLSINPGKKTEARNAPAFQLNGSLPNVVNKIFSTKTRHLSQHPRSTMIAQSASKRLWGYLDSKLETAQTKLASGFWFAVICILIAPRVLIAAIKIGIAYILPGRSNHIVPIIATLNLNAGWLCDF